MVENIVILPLFLAILIVSVDMLLMSVNVLTTRYVSSRVLREASLGDLDEAGIRTLIQNYAGSLGLTLADNQIAMCQLDDYPCTAGVIDRGDVRDLIVLEIRVPLRGIVLGALAKNAVAQRIFDFRARLIGRREP